MVDSIAMDDQTVIRIHPIRTMKMRMDCVHFTIQTGDHAKYNEIVTMRKHSAWECGVSISLMCVRNRKRKRKLQCYLNIRPILIILFFFFTFFSLIVRSCIIMRTHEKYLKEKTFDIYTNIQI